MKVKVATILAVLLLAILTTASAGAAQKTDKLGENIATSDIDVPSEIEGLAKNYANTIPKVKPQDSLKLPHERTAPPGKKGPRYSDTIPVNTSNDVSTTSHPTISTTATTLPPSGYPVFPIAIINNGTSLTQRDLDSVAAALQTQVNRDFLPYWQVAATVVAYSNPAEWPGNSWPIYVDAYCAGCDPGTGGYHYITSDNKLPYAEVQYDGSGGYWPVYVSHELLEMIEDPTTLRVVSYGHKPYRKKHDHRLTYNYYVEVADPVEGFPYIYHINGWPVSSFVMPNYFSAYFPRPYDFEDLTHGWLQPLCYGYQEYYIGSHGKDRNYRGPCPDSA